ncbi:MAG: hypothetical protein KF884_09175 [Fimbriimonadaceae bacterium]|nr:hypothetical protein [Fimbriimonadaceae bacterium]QYK57719.1 MAG: hypothetical protein KF884_09175 [Fimbriimonadaceae bacterium]
MFASLLAFVFQQAPFAHEPFSAYSRRDVAGWAVYLSPAARLDSGSLDPAISLLDRQLREIATAVPTHALKALKKIPIFVENKNPDFPCACYHTSPEWLRQNGYIPEKAKSVEIANPVNYVQWIGLNQPWMTFHELAHGYHDTVYGFDDPVIAGTYRLAKLSGKYESVAHNRGGERRAYALNNPMEYFAELSEAYFGVNDYYPFVRAELREFDPDGYDMIERKWGVGRYADRPR